MNYKKHPAFSISEPVITTDYPFRGKIKGCVIDAYKKISKPCNQRHVISGERDAKRFRIQAHAWVTWVLLLHKRRCTARKRKRRFPLMFAQPFSSLFVPLENANGKIWSVNIIGYLTDQRVEKRFFSTNVRRFCCFFFSSRCVCFVTL